MLWQCQHERTSKGLNTLPTIISTSGTAGGGNWIAPSPNPKKLTKVVTKKTRNQSTFTTINVRLTEAATAGYEWAEAHDIHDPDECGGNSRSFTKVAVLDGEIVALNNRGVPCFDGLRSRRSAAECVIVYYAFDLIYLDGLDLTQCPLVSRKATLKKILPKQNTARVRYTDHIVGEGERLFAELEKRRLEGMVAKRSDSLYVSGRTRAWLKIKTGAGREEMRKRSEAWRLQ